MGKLLAVRAVVGTAALAVAAVVWAGDNSPQATTPQVEAFKQLVGSDNLSAFEAEWRTFVADLAAGRIKAAVPVADPGKWKMDRITLKPPPSRKSQSRERVGSRVLSGLIVSQAPDVVQIMVISRPTGRKLFARIVTLERDDIEKVEELSVEDHARLNQLVIQHFSRDELAKTAESLIKLEREADRLGRNWWLYSGPSFDLATTIDSEQTTREAIFLLEQRIKAFHDYFPPRHAPQKKLSIKLLSEPREYQQYLAQLGLRVNAQALFDARGNQVIGYYDSRALKSKLEESRQHHQALQQQLHDLEEQAKEQRRKDSLEFDRKGFTPDEIRKFNLLRENKFKKLVEEMRQKIAAAERHNQEMYNTLSGRMYRALYHEAFHAYLENYLFNHRDNQVPRWLNEGLAQVFEHGLVEAGTLRIDVPDAERLKLLSAALENGRGMTLMELFSAGPEAYLTDHNLDAAERKPHYLYAWGLTYYLLTQRHLSDKRLEEFVRPPQP